MRTKFLIPTLAFALSFTVMGCQDNTTGSNGKSGGGGNFTVGGPSGDEGSNIIYKSSVQYADLDELLDNEAECNGHSDQVCVYVCHRPPGNPTNEKTKILPIKALTAHLNHGADHHNDHDYVGPCESDTGNDDPDIIIIIDDPDGGEGAEGGSSNEEVPDEENEGYGEDVPTWCEVFYDQDKNCDGYDDEFFAPTF